MIGRPRVVVIATAVVLYTLVHVLLAVTHAYKVTDHAPYYVALVLLVGASLAVLLPAPTRFSTAIAVAEAVAVVVATGLVLSVLPAAKPSYAMWYVSLTTIPMGGVVLRGHPVVGVTGAVLGAAATLMWSATNGPGLTEGLYRVTTPTAVVVVCVGIALLMRASRREVERAHAERVAASEFSAAVRAAQAERADRISDVARLATPVLTRLADGTPPGRRLALECRLLEGNLRDGIRARGLTDAAVSAAAWAARSRGVDVVLLDDAMTGGAVDNPDRRRLRSATARCLEAMSSGHLTARLTPQPGPLAGTVVVISPEAEFAAAAAGRLPGVAVDLTGNEVVLTVNATTRAGQEPM